MSDTSFHVSHYIYAFIFIALGLLYVIFVFSIPYLYYLISIIFIFITFILLLLKKSIVTNIVNQQCIHELNQIYSETYDKLKGQEYSNRKIEKELQNTTMAYEAVISKDPFKAVATLHANLQSVILNRPIEWLTYKPHKALKSAEEVKLIKKDFRVIQTQLSYEIYKRDFFLNTFPEYKPYFDDFESLMELRKYEDAEQVKNDYDYARDYLTDQEWSSLSPSDRNQLALDRYVKRQKSPWQIGRDFEMCCAWKIEQRGLKVVRFGIEHGKQDLGRDLIAFSRTNNKIYIIQCKCWKSDRLIRENIIAQLYGTTFAFEKEYKEKNRESECCVKPVLAIPQFSNLSDVAEEFCNKLGVIIQKIDYDNYPRIKCNINAGSKIYHLPFDQQYDRTKILKPEECYAFTVKEAESKGFRRAKRHFYQ